MSALDQQSPAPSLALLFSTAGDLCRWYPWMSLWALVFTSILWTNLNIWNIGHVLLWVTCMWVCVCFLIWTDDQYILTCSLPLSSWLPAGLGNSLFCFSMSCKTSVGDFRRPVSSLAFVTMPITWQTLVPLKIKHPLVDNFYFYFIFLNIFIDCAITVVPFPPTHSTPSCPPPPSHIPPL